MLTGKNERLLQTYAGRLGGTSKTNYVTQVNRFLTWVGKREINRRTIDAYLYYLKMHKHFKPGSLRHTWDVIRAFCRANSLPWPYRYGEGPAVSERDVDAPILDPSVISKMIYASRNLSSRDRVFLALSTTYGLRRQEMAEITSKAIDLNHRLIWISTAKRGRQRYHLIPPEILPHLRLYDFKEPVPLRTVNGIFDRFKAAVGLKANRVSWHSIRRSLTRSLMMADVPLGTIHIFLRWKRSEGEMALRYPAGRIVTLDGESPAMGLKDEEIDRQVFASHPFLVYWAQLNKEIGLAQEKGEELSG